MQKSKYYDNMFSYLYESKSIMTKNEQSYFAAIRSAIPKGYYVYPQVALASIINKTDDSRYHNELFRVVDFVISDRDYTPRAAIEINDRSHQDPERKERDEKVAMILCEAGIPLITLMTSDGVNAEQISQKITEALNTPVERKCFPQLRIDSKEYARMRNSHMQHGRNSSQYYDSGKSYTISTSKRKKAGCYIATAVYGSYDCPEVWTLRRYRDYTLQHSVFGRAFVKFYYAISPTLVRQFGNTALFNKFWRCRLDSIVRRLQKKGYESTPYNDR